MATYSLTDTLPVELHPFFPSNEELVRCLDPMEATLQVGHAPGKPYAGHRARRPA